MANIRSFNLIRKIAANVDDLPISSGSMTLLKKVVHFGGFGMAAFTYNVPIGFWFGLTSNLLTCPSFFNTSSKEVK